MQKTVAEGEYYPNTKMRHAHVEPLLAAHYRGTDFFNKILVNRIITPIAWHFIYLRCRH